MKDQEYRPALDVMDLVGELKLLLVAQRRSDRLICRYFADLSDGMASCMRLILVYGDVYELGRVTFGLSFRAIRERIRVGRALRALPLLDAALTSGELTYSRVREVTRAATPETERLWLAAARRLSMRALELRVAEARGAPRSRARTAGDDSDSVNPMQNLPAEVVGLLRHAMHMVRTGCEHELTDAEALAAVARAAISYLNRSSSAEQSPRDETRNGSPRDETHSGSPGDETHSGSPGDKTHSGSPGDETHSGSPGNGAEGTTGALRKGDTPNPARRGPAGGGTRERIARTPDEEREREAADYGTSNHHGSHGRNTERAPRTSDERQRQGATQAGWGEPDASLHEPLSSDEQLLLELVRSGGYWNAPMLLQTTEMPYERLANALFDLQVKHLIIQGPFGSLEASTFRKAG